MKSKLGIVLALMCVASFFLYRMGENNKTNNFTKEELIQGIVIDDSTNKPIVGVAVAVAGTNPKSKSDENGEFLVLGRTSDDFIFKHPNYKSKIISGKEIKLVRLTRQDS